jgi:hypothetical protein
MGPLQRPPFEYTGESLRSVVQASGATMRRRKFIGVLGGAAANPHDPDRVHMGVRFSGKRLRQQSRPPGGNVTGFHNYEPAVGVSVSRMPPPSRWA